MPGERVSMRKIKELFRLRYEGRLSERQIAQCLQLSRGGVHKLLAAGERAGVKWPWPEGLSEAEVERRLYATAEPAAPGRPVPDWAVIHQELKRKGVTRSLLWEEYLAQHPDGYRYTQFCELYQQWREGRRRSLRQVHRAGEKLFVDYCGPTVAVQDEASGKVRAAQIFVAVLGASNYTYAEATWTQGMEDWVGAHVRALTFYGGAPELIIPDNVKAGVRRACRYEPELTRIYADLAAHYQTAILPARPYKPKDKAKVESGVQVVERWILARLRHETFIGLAALNRAIRELLEDLNQRPFKRLPGNRRSQFEALDRPALRPLPALPYEYAEWKRVRVGADAHIEVAGHAYSVPHALVRREVEVRLTATAVELFHGGERVATHARSFQTGGQTTLPDHLPEGHQAYLVWSPARLRVWAAQTGPATLALAEQLLASHAHPQQGTRAGLGLLHLERLYGTDRLEAAAARAAALNTLTRDSVASILKTGLDRQPWPRPEEPDAPPLPLHQNLRGAAYYQSFLTPTESAYAASSNLECASPTETFRDGPGPPAPPGTTGD